VDYVKIDGSFVKGMVENELDDAIVLAINNIGRVLGIETIAEFVENDRIMQKLKEIGVDFAQGYGIARPQPLSENIAITPMENVAKALAGA
jgi:EAL domain-containing protein (putative c-di-GMP-specific phosphodiesterase class I)